MSATHATHRTHRAHPAQSALNLELINHVATHEPCGFDDLFAVFGGTPLDGAAKLKFSKRLSYLVNGGKLCLMNHGGRRHWCVPQVETEAEAAALEGAMDCPATTLAEQAKKWVGTVVPPRQHSVMHGALYVPEAETALRPGALDYRRVPTHGVRC